MNMCTTFIFNIARRSNLSNQSNKTVSPKRKSIGFMNRKSNRRLINILQANSNFGHIY